MYSAVENAQQEPAVDKFARMAVWFQAQYWIGCSPALLLLLYRDLVPYYIQNDAVRLTSLRQVVDPAFLSQEWLAKAGYSEDSLTLGFKFLFAPLYLFTKQGILVAMAGRVVIWAILLFAIYRLARALHLPRYALLFGLPLFILHQSLGASEWIFGGLEGKCMAYAGLMLAIDAFLSRRLLMASLLCGFNFWFHVPVALWGGLAVFGGLLLWEGLRGYKRLLEFGLVVAMVCLPMFYLALKYAGAGGMGGNDPQADWLIVVFRNPHHMVPSYFHGGRELLRMLACVALTIPGLNLLAGGVKSKFLCGVLGTLLLEFIAGLVAWRLHLYWFLKAYPFRVADVLVWFLCCLLLPTILVSFLQRTGIGERMDFTIQPRMALICTVALLVLVAIPLAIRYQQGRLHALRFSPSSSRTTPYLEMTQWIRSNTPAGAIFVAPPWLMDFFLDAERAEVVNFKRNPHNFLIVEWYRRYCAMNGGQPFHSTGFESVEETRANFPRLSLAQLDEIHRLYGGNYYLTVQGRDDLGAPPVHENAQFYLYKLR